MQKVSSLIIGRIFACFPFLSQAKNLQHWDDGAASYESKKSDILWGGQDQAKRVEARKNEDWNTVAKCEKIRVKCGTRKRVWISFFVSFYITGYLQITSSAPSSLKTQDSKSQILVRSSSPCSAHCCEWIMSRRRKVKISVRIRRSWTLHDNDDVITSKSAAWRARLDVTTAHTMSCLRRTIRGKERKKKKNEKRKKFFRRKRFSHFPFSPSARIRRC